MYVYVQIVLHDVSALSETQKQITKQPGFSTMQTQSNINVCTWPNAPHTNVEERTLNIVENNAHMYVHMCMYTLSAHLITSCHWCVFHA